MTQTGRPWFLSAKELPWWRRAVACLALLPAVAAWNGTSFELAVVVVGAPLLLMHVNRSFAQLAVRIALGATLLEGCRLAAKPFGAPAAAIALLALGAAGLAERPRDDFRPAAHRGLLQALLVVTGIQLLWLCARLPHELRGFSAWMLDHWRRVAFELLWPPLCAIGLWGTYRLRIWGLYVQAAALLGLLAFTLLGRERVFGIVWLPLEPHRWLPLILVSLGLMAVLWLSLARGQEWPVLSDRVKRWGQRALVLGLALAALGRHWLS